MIRLPCLIPAVLVATAFASVPPARAEGVKKFTRSSLTYWTIGPEDWGDPFMKKRCGEGDQARVQKAAEARAIADCEAADGNLDCLVKNSLITFNAGNMPDEILRKYNLNPPGGLYSYHGCEAQALVYGINL